MDGYILITDLKKATSSFTWRCFLLKGRSSRDIYIYIIYLWNRNIVPKNTCKFHPSFWSIHYCLQGLHKMPPIRAGRDCNSYRQMLVVCLDVWYQGNVFLPGKLTLRYLPKKSRIRLKSGKSIWTKPSWHCVHVPAVNFQKNVLSMYHSFQSGNGRWPCFLQRREPNLGGICFLTSMIMEVQEMEVQNGECLGSN